MFSYEQVLSSLPPPWPSAAKFSYFRENSITPTLSSGANTLRTTSTTDLITWNRAGGFTCEYWLYVNDITSCQYPTSLAISVGPGNNEIADNYWSLGPIANGALQLYYYTGSLRYITSSANLVLANTWNHIAMSCNGLAVNLFLNGDLIVSSTASATPQFSIATPFDLGIGGVGNSSGTWNVYMRELRVSSIQRYTANFTPQTTPFTSDANTQLLLHFDEPLGSTTFTDSSSFARVMTQPYDTKVTISN